MFSLYLLAALGSPRPSSSEAAGREPVCLRSSSGRFCCRRWLCRTPGSSGLRTRCGARRSSGGPAGRPAAGSHPVDGSERRREVAGELRGNKETVRLFAPANFPRQCVCRCHAAIVFQSGSGAYYPTFALSGRNKNLTCHE